MSWTTPTDPLARLKALPLRRPRPRKGADPCRQHRRSTPNWPPSEPLGGGDAEGKRVRRPFSLIYRGPLTPILPQQIYPVEHPELGTLELFLVPVGPEGGGMQYEAVFT